MTTSSTTGTGSFSALLLLAFSSFVAADLTIGEEEEGLAAEEECVSFFTTTDEAGTTFYFLNPGGRTGTSSTSTFTSTTVTATDDEGTVVEERAKRLVPGSLRLWRLAGFVISKGGSCCGGGEEVRGVEGGVGEGDKQRRSAWSVRVAK